LFAKMHGILHRRSKSSPTDYFHINRDSNTSRNELIVAVTLVL
jgi:hypothetical protein